MPGSTDDIQRLVDGFARNLREVHAPESNEDEIRQEYIDPFWEALGWDVANTAQRSAAEKDVVVERRVRTVEEQRLRSRPTDYIFRINGFSKFVVEAKKATVDVRTDRDAIFQAKTYAWGAQIPFAVLTNFEQFRLFDCTLKPYYDEPERGIVHDFDLRYEQYVPQWDVLLATFGREAVANNSLDQLLAKIKRLSAGRRLRGVDRMLLDLRGTEPFDRAFLAHLENYRQRFAEAIYRANKLLFPDAQTRHGAARLTEAIQRLIDRLVFMRVCEDRDITDWGGLRETLARAAEERSSFYELLVADFRHHDRNYNGYLFKPHFSEELQVPDELLAEFIRSLYLPEGPYRFDAIESDLLGIIYERFLGSVLAVKHGHVQAEEKPEVRHAGGVYYTPRFVVNTIIRRVIGPKLEGRTPAQVLDLKILDPACGSGSFLIAAFQYLMDYCERYVAAHPEAAQVAQLPAAGKGKRKKKQEIAFQDRQGDWHLAPDFRAALLTSCLHGVDIDAQAVEVTVMNLYLKMLEGKLPPNWQRDWIENQLLPPLDNNICCGNSLLSQRDFDRWWEDAHGALFAGDEDVRFRMNPFDWASLTRGFGRLLEARGGFDCIIGNPPYIRVQELNKWAPDECEFYKWRYRSAKKGNYDIYVVFIERALELLAPGGLLGFICPHKFWQAAYGAGLRQLLADGKHLRSVIDFGDQQVFQGPTTYTAVHVFAKDANRGSVDYARVTELTDGDAQCGALSDGKQVEGVSRFKATAPTSIPWCFEPAAQERRKAAMDAVATLRLGDLAARMFQGLRTSMNEVFVLECRDAKKHIFFSKYLGKTVELEIDLLKPFLGGEDIQRYLIRSTSTVLLVPYQRSRNNQPITLADPDALSQDHPKTWHYLKQCEKVLRSRERGRMNHDGWFGYVYPKNLDLFGTPRIIVRDIIDCASFALDAKGMLAFVSGYGIILKDQFSSLLTYVLGVLNSGLLDQYLKSVSTTLRGGWFRPFPQFLKQLPIKIPESAEECRLAARITGLVQQIIDAKQRLQAEGLSEQERTRLERQVEAHEAQIDELVCRLYGVAAMPE